MPLIIRRIAFVWLIAGIPLFPLVTCQSVPSVRLHPAREVDRNEVSRTTCKSRRMDQAISLRLTPLFPIELKTEESVPGWAVPARISGTGWAERQAPIPPILIDGAGPRIPWKSAPRWRC